MINWITDDLATAPRNEVEKSNYKIIDVRDMVDKRGNSSSLILEKINNGIKLIKRKNKIIICCDYGLSRSNAIAAGILVKYYGYNYEEAVNLVLKKTGQESIELGLLESVRGALGLGKIDIKKKDKKTILITGADGFIGSAFVELLKEEYELITPSRSEINLLEGPIKLDLLVKKTGTNLILHLANPKIYTTTKAMGEMIVMLKNVLEVCNNNKISIIYPSGWVVFNGYYNKKVIFASENLKSRPKDTYGQSKFLCETLLNYYKEVYGLKICLLRLSPVYGVGSEKPKFIRTFFEKAKNNFPIYTHKYKNGLPVLDLINVKDVVSAIKCVIEKNFYGTLHIGSGKGISTFEIAEKIKEICSSKSKIFFREIDDYNANIIMDITKAKKILKWSPNISIDEGLKEIFADSKNHKII